MSIKSFAYQLSLKSQNQIKRSQCYELFAAAHGYKTYAAIDCVVAVPEYWHLKINVGSLASRSRAFGFDPELVQSWLTETMADLNLKPFTFSELAMHIEYHPVTEIHPFVEALLPLAEGGNGMAHYCLALLYAEDRDEPVSDYWYRQRMSGKCLSEMESEYADEYQSFFENTRLGKIHLNAAADLGIVSALVQLALKYDDPRILVSKADLISTEILLPWGVGAIADYALSKDRKDEYHRWLTLGCGYADIEAIDQLASSLAKEKPVAALSLVKFASLLGVDLTQTRTRAVDEHGEEYDDDIGGAMYIDEIEGVNIENVTGSEGESAERLAKEWFRQYEARGRASISID